MCHLPCSSPCVRLPCDVRCERKLICGHRCPSVCGEDCPPKEYCQICGSKGEEIVDLIMYTKYQQVDLSSNPILVLGCGHFYTMETLDGQLELEKVYEKTDKARWNGTKTLQEVNISQATCADCRAPIRGIKRYGRVLKAALLLFYKQRQYRYLEQTVLNQRKADYDCLQKFKGSSPSSDLLNTCHNVIHREPLVNNSLTYANQAAISLCKKNNLESDEIWIPEPVPKVSFLYAQSQLEHRLTLVHMLTYLILFDYCTLPRSLQLLDTCAEKYLASVDAVMDEHELVDANLLVALMLSSTLVENWTKLKDVATTQHLCSSLEQAVGSVTSSCMQLLQRISRSLSQSRAHAALGSKLLKHFMKWVMTEEQLLSPNISADVMHNAAILEKKFSDVFYQQVTDEELYMVLFSGQRDWGNATGSFGRYNECPNGHIYVIGECGGAMEESKCPECGAAIGGSNHRILSTNSRSDRVTRVLQRR